MKEGTKRMGSTAVVRPKAINTEGHRLRQYRGHGSTGGREVSYSIVAVRERFSMTAQDGGRLHQKKIV